MLDETKRFMRKCPSNALEEIYDNLSDERKSLVTPIQISVKEKVKQWQAEAYEKNLMYPENLRYETEQGDMVRSKSEVIIANILYRNRKDILYKYEKPLEVMENGRQKTIYPDFTILNKHTGKVTYWEHAGRMDDSHYASAMDIQIYNDMLDTLSHRELICGFLSGKKEIMNWEPSDLFQFCNDTTPIKGSLDEVMAVIDESALNRAIKIGACNIYHGCVHNMLHEKSEDILRGLYKSASFVVQAIAFKQTGNKWRNGRFQFDV